MKLYPIGTIVHLKGIAHPIMIIGFYQVYEEKVYEYVGVPYPTGLVSTNSMMAFRPPLIEALLAKGYEDENAKKLDRAMDRIVSGINAMHKKEAV